MESENSNRNLDLLVNWFQQFRTALVAFSSGVDSSVVAFAAFRALGDKSLAVTSISPAIATSELSEARVVAEQIGIPLQFVRQHDLEDPNYITNNVSRCYFCRTNLSRAMLPIIHERKFDVWVDGTQIDDLRSPRPGIKALREAGFRAPLVELGFGKLEVRSIARSAMLSNSERPSESCLSSRIAYGQEINRETLDLIEYSENVVRASTDCNIVRVRTIGKKAVIEVDKESISKAIEQLPIISEKLISKGYDEVTVDPEGYSSGKMLELFVQENK